jgi:hypothetical protein
MSEPIPDQSAEAKPRIQLPMVLRPKGAAPVMTSGAPPRDRPFPWKFFVFVAVLALGGWLLVSTMSDNAKTEDCGMSGRKNCVPLDPKLGR